MSTANERLSENLWRNEFRCNCGQCERDTADAGLVRILQHLVNMLTEANREKHQIHISSGHRCPAYNAKVGGAKNSQHLYGRAADFRIVNTAKTRYVEPEKIYQMLDKWYPKQYGLGLYPEFVHFDTRSGRAARWRKTE